MPMMYGFSEQRRQMLDAEARRFADEAAAYGAMHAVAVGEYAAGVVGPDTELELVIVQDTDEPFRRRADFWVSHMRPRLGTRFLVYTPEEYERFESDDPVLLEAARSPEVLIG